MKPLEIIFFMACVNEQRRINSSKHEEFTPRAIGNIFSRLGFSYKQLCYYLRKWCGKGFYDYGVTLDLGWFDFGKLTGAYKRIYDNMNKTDDWEDDEFMEYIAKQTQMRKTMRLP